MSSNTPKNNKDLYEDGEEYLEESKSNAEEDCEDDKDDEGEEKGLLRGRKRATDIMVPTIPDEDKDKFMPSITLDQVANESSDVAVINADVTLINLNLVGLTLGWRAKQLPIKDACSIALATARLLETRRKLLNRQYGAKESNDKGKYFTPID